MRHIHCWKRQTLILTSLVLTLAFIVACGAAAPAAPEPGAAPPAAPAEVGQPPDPPAPAAETAPTPVAEPAPAVEPAAAVKPQGTLNVGQEELNIFSGHPALSVNPQLFVISTAPVVEGLMAWDSNLEAIPLLAESWSISEDFLTWTFNIRQGVQFHKGYGEMTAEDVAWSYTQWVENSVHARASAIERFWDHPDGYVEVRDPYTVVVNTGEPMPEVIMSEFHRIPSGIATWITSQRQSEELGVDAADRDIAATGPWEIVDHRPAQFWKMQAVEDHWRQTPHFAELVFWEIPEESTRIAGFQTGQLDTFVMAFDSIPLVEATEGARLLRVPDQAAGEMLLHLHGGLYLNVGTDRQEAAYDPELPWVSANPDLDSPEWARARMVRHALVKAIDTQTMVDTLLGGFARPSPVGVGGYSYSAHRFPDIGKWEYDPEGARELLAEAGYPGGGFSITLVPALRGAPAEVEAGEAIASMWNDIGVDVRLQRLPYATLRPQVVGRTFNGASNHATSPSNTPARLYLAIQDRGSFVRWTHPWTEDIAARAQAAVDLAEMTRLETEVGQFLFREAIYVSLYLWDAVWPVGPNLDDQAWAEGLFYGDIRNMNGFEYIRHREQ